MPRIMEWVNELPGVANTGLPERREQIKEKMEAAAALQEQAKKLEEEAYFSSLRIEADAKRLYSFELVSKAKELT